MHTLTDLQVLALLAAAPIDHYVSSGNGVRSGHVTPWESMDIRASMHGVEMGGVPCDRLAKQHRAVFARVFGLPARESGDVEPIVMTLAWESDAAITFRVPQWTDVLAALRRAGFDGVDTLSRIEDLCAEVLELRANAAALLRADVGPESERAVSALDQEELAEERARPAHVRRYDVLAASPIRSDEEQAEVEALLARLRAEGAEPSLLPVEREAIPPYPGDDPERTAEVPCLDAAETAEHETIAAAASCSYDVPTKPLYYCAGPSCPGYPYATSSLAHPPNCYEVKS